MDPQRNVSDSEGSLIGDADEIAQKQAAEEAQVQAAQLRPAGGQTTDQPSQTQAEQASTAPIAGEKRLPAPPGNSAFSRLFHIFSRPFASLAHAPQEAEAKPLAAEELPKVTIHAPFVVTSDYPSSLDYSSMSLSESAYFDALTASEADCFLSQAEALDATINQPLTKSQLLANIAPLLSGQ